MATYEDDDVEFQSPEEILWRRVKESTETRIKNTKEALIIDEAFLELAKEKIKEENISSHLK